MPVRLNRRSRIPNHQEATRADRDADRFLRPLELKRGEQPVKDSLGEGFQKILVYLNTSTGNSHALTRAGVLARRTGARLKVVDVVERPPKLLRALGEEAEKTIEIIAEEKRERLAEAVSTLSSYRLSVETDVLVGTPFAAITREVVRHGHDLVMKTADYDGSTRLFGSTATNLMRKCPCPVWVVKPVEDYYGPSILVAVNPTSQADGAAGLNRKIVEIGRSLAAMEGGDLHLVHAWQAPYEDTLTTSARIPEAELGAYIEEARAQVQSSFREFQDQFDFRLPARKTHLLRGAPGVVIPRFAARRRFDLIVMGTTARTGVAGLLIGNSAERILSQAQSSVLVVKPEGFSSPVHLDF